MKKRIHFLTEAALIAALYVVLTGVSALFGLSSGTIQVRLGEVLTVLPFLTPAAIPGVTVGCLLANILTGGLPWDVVFGTLATLIGAVGTYALRRFHFTLAPIPPILANALIIPLVLQKVYGVADTYPFLLLTVGIGEILSAGILGIVLLRALRGRQIFPS